MKKRILVAVDMQNDFVDGNLGTKEAQAIVPNVVKKIEEYSDDENCIVLATYDTHQNNYLDTLEGNKLPVKHCIQGSTGWELNPLVNAALQKAAHATELTKRTFGKIYLGQIIKDLVYMCWSDEKNNLGSDLEIELVGLCTSICVVSNAIILRAAFPEAKIKVDSSCCACVTPQSHQAALETMKMCQIEII